MDCFRLLKFNNNLGWNYNSLGCSFTCTRKGKEVDTKKTNNDLFSESEEYSDNISQAMESWKKLFYNIVLLILTFDARLLFVLKCYFNWLT